MSRKTESFESPANSRIVDISSSSVCYHISKFMKINTRILIYLFVWIRVISSNSFSSRMLAASKALIW